jgi:hypothetical protein
MRRIRTQGRTARIPSEVVQFVARMGHVNLPYDPAIDTRLRVNVYNGERVRLVMAIGV